jgi:hypothetical protein
MLGLSVLAAIVFVLVQLGALPIRYEAEWAARGAFAWLVVNAALVWMAIGRVRSLRYAAERRSSVRFALDLAGSVDGVDVTVQDVSVGGALVARADALQPRERYLVTFQLPDRAVSLWATARSSRVAPDGTHHYAFEFEAGQYPAKGRLARVIFGGRYPVAGVERRPWADLLRTEVEPLSRRFRRVQPAGRRPVGAAGTGG